MPVGASSAVQGLIGHASGAMDYIGGKVAKGVVRASRAGMKGGRNAVLYPPIAQEGELPMLVLGWVQIKKIE